MRIRLALLALLLAGCGSASRFGGDSACFTAHHDPTPTWLQQVQGFRVDGDARLLVDSSARAVARLTPGAHPVINPNRASY